MAFLINEKKKTTNKTAWCQSCSKAVDTFLGFRYVNLNQWSLISFFQQTPHLILSLLFLESLWILTELCTPWAAPFPQLCKGSYGVWWKMYAPYTANMSQKGAKSTVLASFKKHKNQCLYTLGWELCAMNKGQKSWVHPSHQPEGIQNHINYWTEVYLESCPWK